MLDSRPISIGDTTPGNNTKFLTARIGKDSGIFMFVAVIALNIGNHGERPVSIIHIHCYLLFHNEVQRYNKYFK